MKGIKIDVSDFIKDLKRVARERIPKQAALGITQAGIALVDDAVNEIPSVPLDDSELRGSASVFTDNKLVAVSKYGDGKYALTSLTSKINRNYIITKVIFNAPYAYKMHEDPDIKFKSSGSGNKYLSLKLRRNAQKYLKMIAKFIGNV